MLFQPLKVSSNSAVSAGAIAGGDEDIFCQMLVCCSTLPWIIPEFGEGILSFLLSREASDMIRQSPTDEIFLSFIWKSVICLSAAAKCNNVCSYGGLTILKRR